MRSSAIRAISAYVAVLDPRQAPQIIRDWLGSAIPDIEAYIKTCLQIPGSEVGGFTEAMHYAALGPGKRLRPALVLAAGAAVGADRATVMPAAAAVELLHAYTLVHDDLPCMDDDDERRGRPTVHIAYSEAMAVLVGDGLLTEAFRSLAALGPRAADAVEVLARRAGAGELLAGQVRDLALAEAVERGDGSTLDFAEIETIHAAKTGALFSASTELGAIAGGADAQARASLARYGMAIGIAFQHADDRDDNDFPQYAQKAAARARELAAEAAAIARAFGPRGNVLLAMAEWFGTKI